MSDLPAPTPPKARMPHASVTGGAVESVVADTMRRVHEQLRRGAAPSFEALLAFGEPIHAPRSSS